MDVPPISIFEKTSWSSASANGPSAVQRTNSIVFIIFIHEGSSGEGTTGRKFRIASTRLPQRATFTIFSVCSPESFCGSFGGTNTVSTINCKISESGSENLDCVLDMVVEDKAMATALMWHRSPLQQPLKAGHRRRKRHVSSDYADKRTCVRHRLHQYYLSGNPGYTTCTLICTKYCEPTA